MRRTMPKFIPRDQVIPGAEYTGYVARADGLYRWDHSVTKPGSPTGAALQLRQDISGREMGEAFDVKPILRRTPQERVDSMANRIYMQYQKYGMTEGCFTAVQEEAWKVGNPISFEQARILARKYLDQAEVDWNEAQGKRITRQSPYSLAPGKPRTG